MSNLASVIAITKGAAAIEKHFKLDDLECGPDSSFSILPNQLKSLCEDCENTFEAVKSNKLQRSQDELTNLRFRRSIYFVKSLTKGQKITKEDIRRIRPGYGLKPKYFDEVVGKIVTRDVKQGDAVTLDILSEE